MIAQILSQCGCLSAVYLLVGFHPPLISVRYFVVVKFNGGIQPTFKVKNINKQRVQEVINHLKLLPIQPPYRKVERIGDE
jgi:hypothetical protein